MKQDAKKWASHILLVIWMIVIYAMSAQPGDLSGDISGSLSHMLVGTLSRILGMGWSELEVLELAGLWDFPIRKLAHMTEYGILAMIAYWCMRYYDKWITNRYHGAWTFAVAYAVTDEFHQTFVPDRSGNLIDVCVDATGAALAMLVLWMFVQILQKKRVDRKNR